MFAMNLFRLFSLVRNGCRALRPILTYQIHPRGQPPCGPHPKIRIYPTLYNGEQP